MHLRGGRGKFGLEILVVLVHCVFVKGYEDFLFCHDFSNERVLRCPDGEVIYIQQAIAANLYSFPRDVFPGCSQQFYIDIYLTRCEKEVEFLSCHGKQSCVVNWGNRSTYVPIPDCPYQTGEDINRGYNDYFYVRYICNKPGVDFEEFLICPTSISDRELNCDDGEVIDIQQARLGRLVSVFGDSVCSDPSRTPTITDRYDLQCKKELKFLSYHGKQSCIVNTTMAAVWLPECPGDNPDDPPGRYSDVLYVRYTCQKLATLTLPPLSDVTSDTFDVISPGFPDVTNEGQYDISCSITPSEASDREIKLAVYAKLLMTESADRQDAPNSVCWESFQVVISGRSLICYQESPIRIRNDNMGNNTGRHFTLEYRSDGTVKHKFWIQFTATTVDSGDGVNITVSCTDNLPSTTTTTAAAKSATTTITTVKSAITTTATTETTNVAKIMSEPTESTENSQNNGVIIGSVLGVLLLIVLVAVIVVIVMYRKKHERKDEAAAAPSGDLYSDTTSGQLNNGGNTSGYINASGPQEPYENISSTYTSISEDNDAKTTTDRGPNNDDPGDYDYIKVDDNRNRSINVGTNGDEKYENMYMEIMETKNDKYEDLLTATRDTNKPEPYEELSIAAK